MKLLDVVSQIFTRDSFASGDLLDAKRGWKPDTGWLFQTPLAFCMLQVHHRCIPGFSSAQDDCDWLKKYKQAKVFLPPFKREIMGAEEQKDTGYVSLNLPKM